jgi:hypothetical protein
MSFDWIKSIPDFIEYFDADHQLVISKIGFDDYIKLYQYFRKTGVYFPAHYNDDGLEDDKKIVIGLIGEDNYKKLYESFNKTGIYFSSAPILALKKAWANKNRHICYKSAARTLDAATRTIYRWRSD